MQPQVYQDGEPQRVGSLTMPGFVHPFCCVCPIQSTSPVRVCSLLCRSSCRGKGLGGTICGGCCVFFSRLYVETSCQGTSAYLLRQCQRHWGSHVLPVREELEVCTHMWAMYRCGTTTDVVPHMWHSQLTIGLLLLCLACGFASQVALAKASLEPLDTCFDSC